VSTLINGILAAEERLACFVAATAKKYPRQITAVIATLLLTAGGGAYAVASLGPDASQLPVRQVFETVTPLPVAAQLSALDGYDFTLYRSEQVRAGDTAESLLARLNVNDPAAAAFVRGNAQARAALLSSPGRGVDAEVSPDGRLRKLSARWIADGSGGGYTRFVVEPLANSFTARSEAERLTNGARLASGEVKTSLAAATSAAGLPGAVANQLAGVFAGDLDLRQLRPGDHFAVVYETFEADGQILRTGRVLAAEFDSGGQTHQALWFQPPGGGAGGYYRPDGDSLLKAYLASPVPSARISSGFAMRFDPVLHTWRLHTGVDYAAPLGTPVQAVGDGTVDLAGQESGYGDMVVISHRNNQQTAYAHLSRIDVKEGQPVSAGQTIGAVGRTGWTTGAHVHFEFRVNGQPVNPVAMAQLGGGQGVAAADRPAFDKLAQATRTELASALTVVQASAQ
jgi:murein DD-endopeptidase MepM/ murein hydrolase activator NlpD